MFSHSIRSTALLMLFAGAAVLPSSLRAQRSAVSDLGKTAQASIVAIPALVMSADPTLAPGPLRTEGTFTRPVQARPLDLAKPQNGDRVHAGSNLALMGTGAAAVVVGLLVGGDGGTIISLTGGVLGLVGLYRYLR